MYFKGYQLDLAWGQILSEKLLYDPDVIHTAPLKPHKLKTSHTLT